MDRIESVLKAVQPPPDGPGPEGSGIPLPSGGLGTLGDLGDRLRAIYDSRERSSEHAGAAPLRKMLVIAAAVSQVVLSPNDQSESI